jgi:hypothetical protein
MKSKLGLLFVFSVVAVLYGCSSGGGGGGSSGNGGGSGSSSGGNGGFSLEVIPSEVNIIDDGTTSSRSGWVSAVGTGNPGVSRIYVDVQTEHAELKVTSFFQEGNEIIANLAVADGAWGGTYRGNLVFSICADAVCNRHLVDSPYTIPYTVQVQRAHIRYEPVSAPEDQLVEFSGDHVVINTESGVQAGPIRYRVELDDQLGNLVFPQEMLSTFGVTDISADGFTLNPPALSDGSHLYKYKFGVSGMPDVELPLDIYYFVGREGGVEDQIIFMQDPFEINLLYGQRYSTSGSTPVATVDYIATGIDRNILDNMAFSYDSDVTNWMRLREDWREGIVEIYLSTENLDVGTYTIRVEAEKTQNKVEGALDVIVNITEGILLPQQQYPFRASDLSTYDDTHQIVVRNSKDRAGTWTAETNTPWITLVDSTGEFSMPEESRYLTYNVDYAEVVKLPNNQISEGVIRVTADDDSFPPSELTIKLEKRLPQITSMSLTKIPAAEAFTLEVTGMNLDLVHNVPVGLRAEGSEYLEEIMFSVDFDSLTTTEMKLSHPGILVPGTYEVAFQYDVNWRYGYSIPLVPRTTITVEP